MKPEESIAFHIAEAAKVDGADGVSKILVVAGAEAIRQHVEAVLKVAATHRPLRSDLIGWWGRCSCQKPGEMPIDFEWEEEWIQHVLEEVPHDPNR